MLNGFLFGMLLWAYIVVLVRKPLFALCLCAMLLCGGLFLLFVFYESARIDLIIGYGLSVISVALCILLVFLIIHSKQIVSVWLRMLLAPVNALRELFSTFPRQSQPPTVTTYVVFLLELIWTLYISLFISALSIGWLLYLVYIVYDKMNFS